MAVQQYSLVANDWLNLEYIINDLTQRVVGQELHPTSTPTFADLTITGDLDLTGDLDVTGDLDIGGTVTFDGLTASRIVATDASKGLISLASPLIVSEGGTGAATLTDHGILLGSGTSAITLLGAASNGQLPIGSTGADPVLAELTGTANQIIITNAAGSITLSLPQDYHTSATPTLGGLTVVNAITEFSTDGTLGGNSDSALPTEKAVKTYVDGASTSPGGADTQVQYNNGGVFGGDATFNFNDTTKVLDVDGHTITGTVAIGLDMSGGTFATAVQNWPATPVIQVAGTQTIKFDDTNYNTFIGTNCAQHVPYEGIYNLFIGYNAGFLNDHIAGSTGHYNVYIGTQAGQGISTHNTGYENVAIGARAFLFNQSGFGNFALGRTALYNNTTGDMNIAIGQSTMYSNISGDGNIAFGRNALTLNTLGHRNIGFGYLSNRCNRTGHYNIAIGENSGGGATATENNHHQSVWLGYRSGYNATTSSYTTSLGTYSAFSGTTNDRCVYLGYKAGYRQTTLDDILIIDNQDRGDATSEITDSLMYGVFNATPASQSLRLNVGNLYLGNPIHSDANGGGLITQTFIREDGAGTATSAASIAVSHDGAGANDQLSKMVLGVNTGAGLVQALEIGSDLLATFAGVVTTDEHYEVDGTQVVTNQVIDARCDDAINSGDATTDGVIDSLRDAMITHGLIAAS